MKSSLFFIFLFLIIYTNEKEERTLSDSDDTLNFVYTIRAGPDEEDVQFLKEQVQMKKMFNF